MVPGPLSRSPAGGALKRALLIAAAVVFLAAAAFCIVPLPLAGEALVADSGMKRGEGELRAGAGRARIPLPEHPVLAGYAGQRRSREKADEVYARAIVIEQGRVRAVIAAIDTLLIPEGLESEIRARAEIPFCALIAATHTHTGPGGLWPSTIAGWIGAGAFDLAQRDAVVLATANAIAEATAGAGPAQLRVGRELWAKGPARSRSGAAIDSELVALRLETPHGGAIATLVNYAMHPTIAPRDRLSADWPGAAARQIEKASSGAPALVLQGAVGNTTWDGASDPGTRIATEAEWLLEQTAPLRGASVECGVKKVSLPPWQASPAVPWPFRRAVANVFALMLERKAPSGAQTRLAIGPLTLLGVPGEPVGELALRARPVKLVGLADGYLGYVETPERWAAGAGESGKTYFGPDLARALGLWPQ